MLIDKKLILEAKQKIGKQAALLIAEDLKLEKFDKNNLKSCCPFHSEDTPSFIWSDKPDGLYYHCFGCDKKYDIIDHLIYFHKYTYIDAIKKLFDIAEIEYTFGEQGVKTEPDREYRYPYPEGELGNSVIKYANLRHISEETLRQFDIGQDSRGNMVFNYYDTNDVLCMVKYRPSRKVGKGEAKYWLQKEKGDDRDVFMPLLFGMNKIDITKPLVLTEGEADSLSVAESGFRNVVSIPNGANKYEWIEFNWEFLEQFDKITIFFDNDKPGIETRKEACARLGTWRTRYVDIPIKMEKDGKEINVKDANDILFHFGKEKLLDFINNAQEMPIPDIIDLSKADDFDIETAPGLITGIENLDKILYKFVLGSIVVLTGVKGSGKSSLLNQLFICEPISQGFPVFIFSGELGTSVLKSWVELAMAGQENITMKNDFVHIIKSETKREMRSWYEGKVWSYESRDNNADKILDRAIAVTRRFGVKVWVLDNLMTLDIGATSNADIYECQKKFIVKLSNLAIQYGVLIVLVAHPRKTSELRRLVADDVSGANEIGNRPDYILGVHRFSDRERRGEKSRSGKYLVGKEPIKFDVDVDIFKNRFVGKIGHVPLYFSYPDYRFYRTPKELWKRYSWNKNISPLRTDDPNSHEDIPSGFGE